MPTRLESTDFAHRLDRLRAEAGDDLLDLTVSDPTGTFPEVRERLEAHVESAVASTFERTYQPHPLGMREARKAVVDYYDDRDLEASSEQLVLTSSTSEAYTWLGKILCEPGEALAVPSPSYPLFEHLLRLECVEALDYRLQYEGRWELGGQARRRLAEGDSLRGIVVVNPNNPTGHALTPDEFEEFADLAVERDVPLIVDEVFGDFPVDREVLPSALMYAQSRPPASRPLTFVLSGLSKIAGCPGAKMSWIAVEGPPERRREAMERLEFVGDTFLSVSTVTQLAAPRILNDLDGLQEAVRDRLVRNRDSVRCRLGEMPTCTGYPVDGGWYQVLRLPGVFDEADLTLELLSKCEVAVQPGFFYDFDVGTHLVVSLLTPPDIFDEGLRRLFGLVDTRL